MRVNNFQNKTAFKGFDYTSFFENHENIKRIDVTVNNEYDQNDYDEFKSIAYSIDEENKTADISLSHFEALDKNNNLIKGVSIDQRDFYPYELLEEDGVENNQKKLKCLELFKKLLTKMVNSDNKVFVEYHEEKANEKELIKNNPKVLFDDKAKEEYLKAESDKMGTKEYKQTNGNVMEIRSEKRFDHVKQFKEACSDMLVILDEQLEKIYNNY